MRGWAGGGGTTKAKFLLASYYLRLGIIECRVLVNQNQTLITPLQSAKGSKYLNSRAVGTKKSLVLET